MDRLYVFEEPEAAQEVDRMNRSIGRVVTRQPDIRLPWSVCLPAIGVLSLMSWTLILLIVRLV
jgi:hypothetical protein